MTHFYWKERSYMTSKERVERTLAFNCPDAAPRQMWLLPWTFDHYKKEHDAIKEQYPDDIVHIGAKFHTPPVMVSGSPYDVGEFVDDWGCVFTNIHKGVIGEVKKPLVNDEDWEDVDNVHIPEEWLTFDVLEVNENCKIYGKDLYKLSGACPRPFERLQFIRGTENFYIDLMLRPQKMMDFMEKMHDFYCRLLKKWAQTDVDALSIMDDWGSQNSLLINPKTWKELFAPMYRDYIDIAHRAGKKIFMHSDGYILDIIPELIDMGLDAVNSQIFCMGVEKLAPYAGKITFWGEIDRQHLLVSGTPEDVENAVESVYSTLWKNGGCIAQCEFGPGAKPENVEAVYRAWERLSRKGQ